MRSNRCNDKYGIYTCELARVASRAFGFSSIRSSSTTTNKSTSKKPRTLQPPPQYTKLLLRQIIRWQSFGPALLPPLLRRATPRAATTARSLTDHAPDQQQQRDAVMARSNGGFYAVRVGRKPGVYTNWSVGITLPEARFASVGARAHAPPPFASCVGMMRKLKWMASTARDTRSSLLPMRPIFGPHVEQQCLRLHKLPPGRHRSASAWSAVLPRATYQSQIAVRNPSRVGWQT